VCKAAGCDGQLASSTAVYLSVLRGVEAGARWRGGREALLWSEPVSGDAASDFTAGSRELHRLRAVVLGCAGPGDCGAGQNVRSAGKWRLCAVSRARVAVSEADDGPA
jgi:hypothetical protein